MYNMYAKSVCQIFTTPIFAIAHRLRIIKPEHAEAKNDRFISELVTKSQYT